MKAWSGASVITAWSYLPLFARLHKEASCLTWLEGGMWKGPGHVGPSVCRIDACIIIQATARIISRCYCYCGWRHSLATSFLWRRLGDLKLKTTLFETNEHLYVPYLTKEKKNSFVYNIYSGETRDLLIGVHYTDIVAFLESNNLLKGCMRMWNSPSN